MRNRFIILLLGLCLSFSTMAGVVTLSHDGRTLNANLEQAGSDVSTGPVVLMTHGTLAHRGMEIMAGLQGMFADRGISSLAINLSLGLDDRAAAMYDCATPHTHTHTDAVGEIGAWLGWLKAQGVSTVALLGHSRGGNQTARFAADHDDPVVSAVLLVAPMTQDAAYALQDYKKRYGKELAPLLAKAQKMVAEGKGSEMMAGVDFIYCEDTSATAEAFLSYHGPDEKMDTPRLLTGIRAPVTVFAGTEDTVVKGLIGKVEPLADGKAISLVTMDGADHFFRDLYSEDIADLVAELLEAR
ncbi:MAG: alpha/beta hydrolase [Gammaproteobacteria bacterium]|nr:alpha/beta hydrolase [Gammaproteobacteria bacterium]